MPSLGRALQDLDLGHLRILSELWGLDFPLGRAPEAAAELARCMLEPGLALEIAQALPARVREALDLLLANHGREKIGELALRFGPIRPIGPGRRDREQPWRDPEAALDGLWYRGFIGLGFFETPSGPEEFAYVPDELQEALRPLTPEPPHRLSSSQPPAVLRAAGGAADDAVTLLAALRRRPARSHRDASRSEALAPVLSAALQRHLIHPASLPLLLALLRGLGVLVPGPLRPDPAGVRELLAAGRAEAEARLLEEWRATRRYNDLANTPGLAAPKGKWPNDPSVSRAAVLARVASWGVGQWYDLESAIGEVRRLHPAFLRPGGDFDSWLLQDAASGRLLRGLADWETVEGPLLRQVILGPLHWLGAADHGFETGSVHPTTFRLRFDPASGLTAKALPGAEVQAQPVRVFPDGRLVVPRPAARKRGLPLPADPESFGCSRQSGARCSTSGQRAGSGVPPPAAGTSATGDRALVPEWYRGRPRVDARLAGEERRDSAPAAVRSGDRAVSGGDPRPHGGADPRPRPGGVAHGGGATRSVDPAGRVKISGQWSVVSGQW
ncbi:MAG: uncharacterized protein HW404_550 [Anaerolineales bacterium]|nr:uncharacterized protein [Anaerolineales bacterium]